MPLLSINLANIPAEPNFFTWLWTQGPTIVVLSFGIYLVGRALILLAQRLDKEKQERLTDHIKRIDDLEKRVDDCEEDRAQLREEVRELKRITAR